MEYMEQQMQQQIEAGISNAEQCYARIAELEEQNAALEAELVAVKSTADKMRFKGAIVSNICYNIGQSHSDAEQILQAVKEYDEESRKFRDASSLSQQHHLRQVRADAGRAGYLEGYSDGFHDYMGGGYSPKKKCAQYHASILAGKE